MMRLTLITLLLSISSIAAAINDREFPEFATQTFTRYAQNHGAAGGVLKFGPVLKFKCANITDCANRLVAHTARLGWEYAGLLADDVTGTVFLFDPDNAKANLYGAAGIFENAGQYVYWLQPFTARVLP